MTHAQVAVLTVEAEASRRHEILQRYAALRGQSPAEVLGVAAGADPQTVKAAYQRLVRRVHPDTLGPGAADLTEKAQAVFARASEAFSVLASPPRSPWTGVARAPADAGASRAPRVPGRAAGGGAGRPGPHAAPAAPAIVLPPEAGGSPSQRPSVDDVLREADNRLAAGDAEGTVTLLHGVVVRAKGEQSLRVRHLLARAYAQEPQWRRYAVAQLRTLIEERPDDAEALALLGAVYRREGLLSRAESLLRQALAVDPAQAEAQSQLRTLLAARRKAGVRKSPVAPARRGFVSRLFRRSA